MKHSSGTGDMLYGLEIYEVIFNWSAKLLPAFCAPLCLSAFFTHSPLRNVVLWISLVIVLCCICVHRARIRNNRYFLVPFIIAKLLFFMLLSLISFYLMIKHMQPRPIDHLKELDEVVDSYLHFTLIALLDGLLTGQCVLFMYLSFTLIYDIEYIRRFDANVNIREQIERDRREAQRQAAENADGAAPAGAPAPP